MTDDVVLTVSGLRTHFFTPTGVVKAVDGVNLQIHKGRTLGVLGESGSGKSVTALSVMRLVADPPGRIVDGEIHFDGRDLLKVSDSEMRDVRGADISMIFQEPMTSLNPVMTVGDQVAEVFMIHQGKNREEGLDAAAEMLDQVGIPSAKTRLGDYPHQFSGGMRQRVMIAMAIACRSKLLIADEPTTALDVTIQAQILDLILSLQEELDMAVMLITHDLGVIAETSDEVVVMYAGEVVEYLQIDDLFENAQHPYTQGLLRSIPRLGDKFSRGKQPLQEIPGTVPNLIRLPPGCPFAPRCTHALPKCQQARPPMFTLGPTHGSKCWLSEDDALASAEPTQAVSAETV